MRGARPVVTIESAKKFAERQGYCWVPNPDADLPYDALAYRDHDAIAIRVRTSRNSTGVDNVLVEYTSQISFKKICSIPFVALDIKINIAKSISGSFEIAGR